MSLKKTWGKNKKPPGGIEPGKESCLAPESGRVTDKDRVATLAGLFLPHKEILAPCSGHEIGQWEVRPARWGQKAQIHTSRTFINDSKNPSMDGMRERESSS